MSASLQDRITPWVGRLIAINAVVLLLQQTLFPSEALLDLVTFDPARALGRPWTFVTYMFVHGGLLHLVGNSIALFVFGPPVERRLGSSAFLFYYLYCGLGAAITSLLLWTVAPSFIYPFIGASGAVLGVAFAFAKFHPDAKLYVFPLPMPIKARTLVAIMASGSKPHGQVLSPTCSRSARQHDDRTGYRNRGCGTRRCRPVPRALASAKV